MRYFEREHKVAQESHIKKKVGEKGLDWCYIGESRRRVAELG